jgi:hypothetical protein
VKQQCESEQFIVINDYMKRVAKDFISNGKRVKESKRQRESECERQSIAGRGR